MVAALRRLKSPHGRQPPPSLGVICKGDDHGELNLRIMPKSSIFLNSALATASCSSWRRRAWAKTGVPVVVRQLVAHHGGGVHGQRLVDLWWSDS